MIFVLAGVQLLKGWKYPIFIGDNISTWPGIVETLVDHGTPRELIKLAGPGLSNIEAFDFYARLMQAENRDEQDELAVVLVTYVERHDFRFPGYLTGSSDVEIVRLPITAPEWYRWKEVQKNRV